MSEEQVANIPEVESKARHLGWVPKDEFRGNPEKWVDADIFVERGEHIMPILRENNKRLESEVARLQALVQGSIESTEELKRFHAEDVKRQIERTKAALKEEIKQARTEGDFDLEMDLQEKLAEVKAMPVQPQVVTDAVNAARAQAPFNPHLQEWMQENPWFGKDPRKTSLAVGIGHELREDPANVGLVGRKFYERVNQEMHDYLNPRSASSKVESSRNSGSGRSSRERGYADLPSDAKEACDKDAKKLVGPGKAFKDREAWGKYYAEQYFRGEE